MLKYIAMVVGVILAYAALVVVANRTAKPTERELPVASESDKHGAPSKITVTSWNIGYAGLGKESDFVAAGGKHLLPPSRKTVVNNLNGITKIINENDSDIFLFQELAEPGPQNYHVNVLKGIRNLLSNRDNSFMCDLKTKFVPPPLRVVNGTGVFSKFEISEAKKLPLSIEPRFYGFLFRKMYGIHFVRIPINGNDKSWVIMNIHLAVYDENATIRHQQIREVFKLAKSQFEIGNYVIIGGDWNLEFKKSQFPHNTDQKFLSWVHPFPKQLIPSGWKPAFDPKTATIRSNNQPYVHSENFETIIDGFIVSPNVKIVSVRTKNLGFEFSDHQPVVLAAAVKTD